MGHGGCILNKLPGDSNAAGPESHADELRAEILALERSSSSHIKEDLEKPPRNKAYNIFRKESISWEWKKRRRDRKEGFLVRCWRRMKRDQAEKRQVLSYSQAQ